MTRARKNDRGKDFADIACVKRFALILILLGLFAPGMPMRAQVPNFNVPKGYPMYYEVHEGDTVFYDTIDPIWVFPRGRGFRKNGDWRTEYRMVYNFNKIYPYALVGRQMMAQVDSTIAADATKRSMRTRYIKDVEKELLQLFTADIKRMTISQGFMLLRLIDRECGLSAFEIIKEYESGFAANFWQIIAKLFSHDLKSKYDPKGQDAKLEELVQIWEAGNWDSFYYSIFWDYPPKTVIKYDGLKSRVKK